MIIIALLISEVTNLENKTLLNLQRDGKKYGRLKMSKAYKENPGTMPVPRDKNGLLFIRDLSGKPFGEFTVIGYSGCSGQKHTEIRNELFNDERDQWTVMCSCGLYYIMDDRYVTRQLLHNKKKNKLRPDMCFECRNKRDNGATEAHRKSGMLKLSSDERSALGVE